MASRVPLFDAPFHVIDSRFPLFENNGFIPEVFTVAQYRDRTAGLPVVGGAVVSGSVQRFDQSFLLDALTQLGRGFVGVTQVAHDLPDKEIITLAERRVRGVRFKPAPRRIRRSRAPSTATTVCDVGICSGWRGL
ncbi:amidohydrolase [Rhodococcus sp. AG1013]|uniref:amidohydrolase family protein n=1 Tax=Rhodococcus sp. AG1013 TaxID=2183996 RepID=UPI001C68D9C5|nr:amidohydrolase family protein [Rhodococcus sp. AG1013]